MFPSNHFEGLSWHFARIKRDMLNAMINFHQDFTGKSWMASIKKTTDWPYLHIAQAVPRPRVVLFP
jgi:hypothetical protein